MALVYTPIPNQGSVCPDFSLPGTDGRNYSLQDFKNGKPLLVMFICNHCPYVKAIEDRLIELGADLKALDVGILGISSNDAEDYPEDSFENMKKRSSLKKYTFPFLYDESQAVARAFGAVCTPDFFLYDHQLNLQYRGRLDDSWKDASQVQSRELYTAAKALVEKKPVSEFQPPSMGCSIKWKEIGNKN